MHVMLPGALNVIRTLLHYENMSKRFTGQNFTTAKGTKQTSTKNKTMHTNYPPMTETNFKAQNGIPT